MKPDGTLLLIERVIPVGDTPHSSKAFDLAMLVMAGGQERTQDEYTELLTEAGFRVERVIGTDSSLSIVEAVPTGAALWTGRDRGATGVRRGGAPRRMRTGPSGSAPTAAVTVLSQGPAAP